MRNRYIIAAILAIVVIVLFILWVQYVRGVADDIAPAPGINNTAGPAEGGALETGGALDPNHGYQRLPARNMPHTISEYPPTGPETASPPPSKE